MRVFRLLHQLFDRLARSKIICGLPRAYFLHYVCPIRRQRILFGRIILEEHLGEAPLQQIVLAQIREALRLTNHPCYKLVEGELLPDQLEQSPPILAHFQDFFEVVVSEFQDVLIVFLAKFRNQLFDALFIGLAFDVL